MLVLHISNTGRMPMIRNCLLLVTTMVMVLSLAACSPADTTVRPESQVGEEVHFPDPVLDEVIFKVREFSLFNAPAWFPEGIEIIKDFLRIDLEKEFFFRKMNLLEHARKKTTQKVNLYEKVQIPGYEEAMLKIKRFLEDEENLSKSSQKIVKTRQQERELAA